MGDLRKTPSKNLVKTRFLIYKLFGFFKSILKGKLILYAITLPIITDLFFEK